MSFADLFRTSKFVALSPKQVLTTSDALRLKGHWGLKKTVPIIHTPYITCSTQEDTEGRMKFRSAFEIIGKQERFKENFPLPLSEKFVTLNPPLSKYSKKEWLEVLKEAKEKRAQWRVLVKEGKYAPHDFAGYLGVETGKERIHSSINYNTRSKADTQWKSQSVKGRILNPIKGTNHLAVSIGGQVCLLESGYIDGKKTIGSGGSRNQVHDFWILSVDYNSIGEIEVKVSMRPPRSTENSVENKFMLKLFGFDEEK